MKKVKAPNKPKFVNTRKVLRKEKRKQKKIHRQEHYLKKRDKSDLKNAPGRFVKRPADSVDVENEIKKKKPNPQPSVQDILKRQQQKEKNETEKLKSQMEKQRKQILLRANDDEDKMIKKLEKHLGLNKTKNKNNYFADDGLDYLLEICDRTTSEQIVAAEKHLADVERDSDFEDDLAVVTGKQAKKDKEKKMEKKKNGLDEDTSDMYGDEMDEQSENDDEGSENYDDDEDDDNSDGSENYTDDNSEGKNENSEPETKLNTKTRKEKDKGEKIVSESDLNKVFSDDEVSHLSGDEDSDGSGDEIIESKIEDDVKPDMWEDIYGRKRDKDGNIIKEEKGIYIPPHLRNKDSTTDKQMMQLKRQIKSILNKLAGTNLHWACTSIENLYSTHSRNSVNTALTQLWTEASVSPASSPQRLLAEHAAVVAVLHANVGNEIGAHFLEELSRKFDDMMQTPQPVEDKTLDNLVSCLALLYSFKIYHTTLLYDILNCLVNDLTEKNIDCVLAVLRNVGGVLRKEEPAALKIFIHDTQAKIAKLNESAETGSRIKFLLEVLLAVKNNNLNKIPNYDPTYVEHLKKMCRGIVRKGNYVTPLNIRLEDLLKAHERGKWWVVGSAWEGNRIQEERPTVKLPTTDQKLLELARKQRMNTDVRRSIFCVIMSAEDFMDAFEKLQHLGLKGQQEREIVHVLLACCLNEKTFNPYYAVLAQKLCDFDRKYQLSIQYSIWDKIKELESLSKQAVVNLAQFVTHLIMEKGLPLSVLKIIQFSDLNKKTVRFMRQILLAIIMNADLQASLEVFHRISKPPKLHMLRESLRLFIQHFLIKNAGKQSTILSEDEMATLKERTVQVDKILTIHESKMQF